MQKIVGKIFNTLTTGSDCLKSNEAASLVVKKDYRFSSRTQNLSLCSQSGRRGVRVPFPVFLVKISVKTTRVENPRAVISSSLGRSTNNMVAKEGKATDQQGDKAKPTAAEAPTDPANKRKPTVRSQSPAVASTGMSGKKKTVKEFKIPKMAPSRGRGRGRGRSESESRKEETVARDLVKISAPSGQRRHQSKSSSSSERSRSAHSGNSDGNRGRDTSRKIGAAHNPRGREKWVTSQKQTMAERKELPQDFPNLFKKDVTKSTGVKPAVPPLVMKSAEKTEVSVVTPLKLPLDLELFIFPHARCCFINKYQRVDDC